MYNDIVKDWRKDEKEIGKVILNYLQAYNWDVYQEVLISPIGRIADIIAVQNNKVWIIECKTSFNLSVLEQANTWMKYANYISICIPKTHRRDKQTRNNIFGKSICKKLNMGCLEITRDAQVVESIKPSLQRKSLSNVIISQLKEEHKHFAQAGSRNGYYTPFKNTCKELIDFVKSKKECKLTDAINSINHHYSTPYSAKNMIRHWIETGIIHNLSIQYRDDSIYVIYEE